MEEQIKETPKEELKPVTNLNKDNTKEMSVKDLLLKIVEKTDAVRPLPVEPVNKKDKTAFKWPKLWTKKIEDNAKSQDNVVVLFFNIKGYIEEPKTVPLLAGNMVMIKGAPYEIDPRAFWLIPIGKSLHKVVAIKEIDRRPISNLDIDEIRERGDSTDSDSFLIKAAYAQRMGDTMKKPLPKWIIWVIGGIVAAIVIYMLMQGGGAGVDPTVLP